MMFIESLASGILFYTGGEAHLYFHDARLNNRVAVFCYKDIGVDYLVLDTEALVAVRVHRFFLAICLVFYYGSSVDCSLTETGLFYVASADS